jgi:hypothetical protein
MFIFRASVYTAENCNIHTIRLSWFIFSTGR